MSEYSLERYNHLRYQSESSEKDDFIDFLYKNTESKPPSIDLDSSWEKVKLASEGNMKKSFSWLKIAASVALLIGLSFVVWFQYLSSSETLTISSSDSKVEVSFPDGSSGILNKNSSFEFPEQFGDQRNVAFSGEAYFDIIKSKKPFIISTGEVKIHVLGTAFNLKSTKSEVELFVDRGLVAFESKGNKTNVKAGSRVLFNKKTSSLELTENADPTIMSWRNGIFSFNETPLSLALEQLSGYYNFKYKIQNEKIGNCKITASFDKESLEEVINTLSSILDINISRKENSLKISGKGC